MIRISSTVLSRSFLIFYILIVYAIYPSDHLTTTPEPCNLYQYLTEGFVSGHLYLSVPPEPELLQLADPYEPVQNFPFKLHDASLYQGKYYLYFGLLPELSFYLPINLIFGRYASDGFAAFSFLGLAFLVAFRLIIKIRDHYFPHFSELQLVLAGVLLGLTTGAPFLLSYPRAYEVAIASAYCAVILAFYFLFNALTQQYKTKDVFLFSFFLSLSVAGRPHFALACVALLFAFMLFLIHHVPNHQRFVLLTALVAPSLLVATLIGGYNYLRFGSILDFGNIWQLSCRDMRGVHAQLSNLSEIPRNLLYSIYYYFFQPVNFRAMFPHLRLYKHDCFNAVNQNYYLESVAGVVITMPFLLIIIALPKLLMIYFKEKKQSLPLAWFTLFLLLVPAINILFLISLPFTSQRYEADFAPYLVILAIITLWMWENYAADTQVFLWIKFLFILSACFSVITGLSFGLASWEFKY